MIVSIGNWYRVLNHILELTIKLPGQYQLKKKKIHVFYKYLTMVEIWSTKQYNILCMNLHEFPALGKILYVHHKKYL